MAATTAKARQVNILPTARPEHVREYLRCAADPVYFVDNYVKLRHPIEGTLDFKLWDWQAELLGVFQRERRVIILKARQLGVTELAVTGYALWLIRFHRTKMIYMLSKNGKDAAAATQRATFANDQLPNWLRCGVRVDPESVDGAFLGKSNQEALEIIHRDEQGHKHPSDIESLGATEGAGRSRPASLIILDEWAWQDVDMWAGISGTISTGGQIFGISTAKGMGNRFHKMWVGARRGENNFRAIFLPWNKRPEFDDAWYANEARDKEPWQMAQEHPTTEADAFVQSGRPVFDKNVISRHEQRIHDEELAEGEPEPGLTIWVPPQAGHQYAIGADVAKGLPTGDFDAAVVADRQSGEQVAELHGKWPPEIYAIKLATLGRRYLNALLAVENNPGGHGNTVLSCLLYGAQERYSNLYYYVYPLDQNQQQKKEPGWPTTETTKRHMINAMLRMLREDTFKPRSQKLLAECLVFAFLHGTTMGAQQGFHDDLVIAGAILCAILLQPVRSYRAHGVDDEDVEEQAPPGWEVLPPATTALQTPVAARRAGPLGVSYELQVSIEGDGDDW